MSQHNEEAPTSLIDACGWYGHQPPTKRHPAAVVEEEALDFVL